MLTTGFACATRAVNQPNEILRLHLAQTTLCSASSTGRIVVEVEASYYGGWDHLGPSNSVSSSMEFISDQVVVAPRQNAERLFLASLVEQLG